MYSNSKPKNYDLSLRAIGLLEIYKSEGKVTSADNLRSRVKEGRDAILKAKAELKRAGYIRETRRKVVGQFCTDFELIDPNRKPLWTDSGNSGDLTVD